MWQFFCLDWFIANIYLVMETNVCHDFLISHIRISNSSDSDYRLFIQLHEYVTSLPTHVFRAICTKHTHNTTYISLSSSTSSCGADSFDLESFFLPHFNACFPFFFSREFLDNVVVVVVERYVFVEGWRSTHVLLCYRLLVEVMRGPYSSSSRYSS